MDTSLVLGIIGSICAFISYIVYIRDILHRHTRPHAFSWLPWSILAILTAIIQLQHNAGWSAIITLIG